MILKQYVEGLSGEPAPCTGGQARVQAGRSSECAVAVGAFMDNAFYGHTSSAASPFLYVE